MNNAETVLSDMVMLIVITSISTAVFLLFFWLLRIVPVAKGAIDITRTTFGTMRDPDTDDLTREKAAQQAGIALVAAAGTMIFRSGLVLIAASMPVLIADWAEIVSASAILDFMARWDVILIASAAAILCYIVITHQWPR